MIAKELFEALQGVPEECLCETIRFNADGDIDGQWCDDIGSLVQEVHAAALQRDAMTSYLCNIGTIHIKTWQDGCAVAIPLTFSEAHGATRLHALAAACRYVKEQEGNR